jgi:hypothetical protein
MGKDHTLFALKEGYVQFESRFTGTLLSALHDVVPLPLQRISTGKVVDDKKVFRKFVNVQEENNNPQK